MNFEYNDVQAFLYREARYLDDKDWASWLSMYSKKCEYWVPSWDDDGEPTCNPRGEVSLIYYERRDGLEDRVFRIQTESSSASTPPARTSHLIGNIELLERNDSACTVRYNWMTSATRYRIVDHYFGTTTCVLGIEDGSVRILKKKVLLKNDRIHHVVDIYHF